MAKVELKCVTCNRTFSRADHLVRHNRTIHGMKSQPRKSAGRRTSNGRKKGRVGRPRTVGVSSSRAAGGGAAHLIGEIQTYCAELTSRRAALDAQINAVESAMEAMAEAGAAAPSGVAAGRVGRRGPRGLGSRPRSESLKVYIVKSLRQSSKPLGPTELASAVLQAGYRTNSKHFVRRVSNTLLVLKGLQRAGRGKYRM